MQNFKKPRKMGQVLARDQMKLGAFGTAPVGAAVGNADNATVGFPEQAE